jgi:hypothetical protein
MTDLQFLPCETFSLFCPSCGEHHKYRLGHYSVTIRSDYRPYAAAFSNWIDCPGFTNRVYDLELGIASVCTADRRVWLCDRMHTAEEISRIKLSRGRAPWHAEIHFDVEDVHYAGHAWGDGIWMPWQHYHFFGPFVAPENADVDLPRMTRLADTVIPYLCDNALAINAYAWPLRRPHGCS